MTYGKNQIALLKFLEKYPNRWHRIKRRKDIDAARRLYDRDMGVHIWADTGCVTVLFRVPQMLIKQN